MFQIKGAVLTQRLLLVVDDLCRIRLELYNNSTEPFARPRLYSSWTTVHISTTGQQLAVIGTLPGLSWERSENSRGRGQAALSTNYRVVSSWGRGTGEVFLTATLSLDQNDLCRSLFLLTTLFISPSSLAALEVPVRVNCL